MRGWKNTFHANEKQKKAGGAILISDKIDLKRKITRDKEGYYMMIKGSIQEAQRVPYRINPRRNTPRHILIKLTKTKHK